VLIIFVVALVIINNALVMATLERGAGVRHPARAGRAAPFRADDDGVRGAGGGNLFGALGPRSGAAVVAVMGKVGIPAPNE